MPTAGQEIAKTAHEAQLKYLATLPPEERLRLEKATKIGGITKPVSESRMAKMLSTEQKYRVVA